MMLNSLWSYAIIGFKRDNDKILPLQILSMDAEPIDVARSCNSGRSIEAAAAAAGGERVLPLLWFNFGQIKQAYLFTYGNLFASAAGWRFLNFSLRQNVRYPISYH